MIEILGNKLKVERNVFKLEAANPYIPFEKYKDFKAFKGEIEVETSRLTNLLIDIMKLVKGEDIPSTLIAYGNTSKKKSIALIPASRLSENLRKKGVVGAISFLDEDKKLSGRIPLTKTYAMMLAKEIKKNGYLTHLFYQKDELGKIYSVMVCRDKGEFKVMYPVDTKPTEYKRNKLELLINSYLNGATKGAVLVNDLAVFRITNKGNFAIHTPSVSVEIQKEEVEILKMLVEV